MIPSSPKLAVIVPATDSPSTLERCVEAIRLGSLEPDELRVVTEPAGAGPAAARNLAARASQCDVLVFVDSDVVVHAEALERIRAAFAADGELAALFGSYDDSPEAAGPVSGFRNLLHHHVHQEGAGSAQTFWAGLGAVRREAFVAAGGFDEHRFPFPSIEDVELGLRLSAAGERIVLDPAIRGTHLKRWGVADMIRTDLLRRGVPWVELLLETEGGSAAGTLNLAWRHRLSTVASLALTLGAIARRPRLALLGLAALLALNRRFYLLLLRRRGPLEAVVGVGLHAVHHHVAAASVPIGAARVRLRRRRR